MMRSYLAGAVLALAALAPVVAGQPAPGAHPVTSVTVSTGSAAVIALSVQDFTGVATAGALDAATGKSATGTAAASARTAPEPDQLRLAFRARGGQDLDRRRHRVLPLSAARRICHLPGSTPIGDDDLWCIPGTKPGGIAGWGTG